MRQLALASGFLVAALALASPAVAQEEKVKAAPSAAATAPVNLNTATADQLETLPGIGSRTAMRMIEYRQKNGGFKKIEDLMNIQGIGEKNFLKLKSLIVVSPAKPDRAASGQ